MAPENAYLFAQPGLLSNGATMDMVWVGSGTVLHCHCTAPLACGHLPMHECGLSAVRPLWGNGCIQAVAQRDAHWGPKLPQGGCDETCAAYVLVELEDSETGKVIEGYDRSRFNPIMDEDGINLPLRWNNSTKLPVGGNVTVKVCFAPPKFTVFTWATSSIRATRVTATSCSSLGNGRVIPCSYIFQGWNPVSTVVSSLSQYL